jgi:hypothetical protein
MKEIETHLIPSRDEIASSPENGPCRASRRVEQRHKINTVLRA